MVFSRHVLAHLASTLFLIFLTAPQQSSGKSTCVELFKYELQDRAWGANLLKAYQAFDFNKNPLTAGIEFEGIVRVKMSRSDLAHIIAKEVRGFYPHENIQVVENRVRFQRRGEDYEYVVARDGSIQPPTFFKGIEIKSPILRDAEDLMLFLRVLQRLKNEGGMRASPVSAGIHVHIGFPKAQAAELAFLINIFAAIEKQVYKKFFVFRSRRKKWAKWTNSEAKDLLRVRTPEYLSVEQVDARSDSEKRGLNIVAIKKHGTVEFRLFNSTLNLHHISLMVDFASTLVKAVREKDARLLQFLSEHEGKTILPLGELMTALNVDLIHQDQMIKGMRRQALINAAKASVLSEHTFLGISGSVYFLMLIYAYIQ